MSSEPVPPKKESQKESLLPVGTHTGPVGSASGAPKGWRTREEYRAYMREYMRRWRARRRGEK